mmetsp:Transcript_9324/g.24105  ORF Transcript_9324/g.24105 Transcript_9324/m.24105 type:complete len:218 (-) Transcript_9324:351-1004(-)
MALRASRLVPLKPTAGVGARGRAAAAGRALVLHRVLAAREPYHHPSRLLARHVPDSGAGHRRRWPCRREWTKHAAAHARARRVVLGHAGAARRGVHGRRAERRARRESRRAARARVPPPPHRQRAAPAQKSEHTHSDGRPGDRRVAVCGLLAPPPRAARARGRDERLVRRGAPVLRLPAPRRRLPLRKGAARTRGGRCPHQVACGLLARRDRQRVGG